MDTLKELNLKEETIGETVSKDFRKAQIFKKLGIDFCCGGKKTLKEVCDNKVIDYKEVEKELNNLGEKDNVSLNFDQWELDFLTDYIINTHHKYVKESIPFMTELATKVAKVHGSQHPELIEVAKIFNNLALDFSQHLMKEENILFPYIKELVVAKKESKHLSKPIFGTVDNPTQMMEAEHEQAGEDMGEIRRLTNNYALPEEACNSYQILFKKLAEFENDLFNHVHLENNILFPKSIALEKQVILD
jgi:regulator of cell morphogenesis and NO signaling